VIESCHIVMESCHIVNRNDARTMRQDLSHPHVNGSSFVTECESCFT